MRVTNRMGEAGLQCTTLPTTFHPLITADRLSTPTQDLMTQNAVPLLDAAQNC